jgi:hypothetical protein
MLLSSIPTTIAPMRSATFSVPFKNANNRFASTTQNQPLSQKITVQIPIEQSNESLAQVIQDQQQDQSSSNQSKWYQDKKWKYFTGLGTGAATGIALQNTNAYSEIEDQQAIMQRLRSDKRQQKLQEKLKELKQAQERLQKEFEELKQAQLQKELEELKQEFANLGGDLKRVLTSETFENLQKADPKNIIPIYQHLINVRKNSLQTSLDAKTFDPELYALFLKIKKDLGITENIDFRIASFENSGLQGAPAAYSHQFQTIMLMKDYKKIDKNQIIYLLSHELEHVRQYLHYPGSYQIATYGDLKESLNLGEQSPTGIHLKAETGADANAMGYFDCPECLKYNAADRKKHPMAQYQPRDLPSGYFTTPLGYFAAEDIEPYIERACKEGELCKAHKMLGDPKEINTSLPKKFDPYFQAKQNQNKMNQKYNENLNRRGKSLPLEFYLPKPA